MLLPAVLHVLEAKACKTRGKYATACSLSWERMLEGWGNEIAELTGQEDHPA